MLTYIGGKNFSLFHLSIQTLIVIMGFSISITSFNTYKLNKDYKLLILGASYSIVTAIDVAHTLQPHLGADVNWDIFSNTLFCGRYFEGITLILAITFFHQSLKRKKVVIIYGTILLLMIGGIIGHNIVRYIEMSYRVSYFTTMWSHYFLIIILSINMMRLWNDKEHYKPEICTFTMLALGASILSEICFIFHISKLTFFNIMGHNLKFISFYFIYKAIIGDYLKMPYSLLIESNEKLRQEIENKNEIKEHLQQQEVILQKVLNSLEEGIMVMNDQGEIIHYNNRFACMWGLSDFLSKNRDNEQAKHYAAKMTKDPKTFLNNIQEVYHTHNEGHFEIALLDGRYFESFITPFQVYNTKGWLHSFRDITPIKNNQKLLIDSQKRYRLLMDSMPDAVILHHNLKCIYANAACAKLFGIEDKKKAIGMNLLSILPYSDIKNIREKGKNLFNNNTYVSSEYIILDSHKNLHYVESFSSLYGDKEDEIVLTILREVTQKKVAEELQRDMEEKERKLEEKRRLDEFKIDFYTNLSHELKTPINIISAVSHLIKIEAGIESPKMGKYVSVLKQNCNRMIRLINNLIDMNKIDSGYFPIEMKNYNIVQVVEDISYSVIPYMEEKNISFIFDTDIEEKILAIDINSVERILLNLLSNAIKFTLAGGEIQVVVNDLKDAVAISVKDTGVGIEKTLRESIFERFKQGYDLHETNPRGSGIGLSLVKHLVEMHQGSIEVFSEVGQGSEFKVILPAKSLRDKDGKIMIEAFSVDKTEQNGGIDIASIEMSDVVI